MNSAERRKQPQGWGYVITAVLLAAIAQDRSATDIKVIAFAVFMVAALVLVGDRGR
ncbi:hypothetical protein ACIP4Y_26960 [Streptomyces sp. NPDC088810]|uniref:hypothetical protein n=1 Tax=Streptomyces sp. NPDC088810 TaxID=3365904 RepID=UPI0037F29134